MPTATVTSKGQITLPKEVRDRLGLRPGHQVQFEFEADGKLVVHAKTVALDSLAGSLRRPGRRLSLAAMEDAMGEGAVEGFRRSVE